MIKSLFKRRISLAFFLLFVGGVGSAVGLCGLCIRDQMQQKNAERWLIENGFKIAFNPDSANMSWRQTQSWGLFEPATGGCLDDPPYDGFLEAIGLDRIRNKIKYVALVDADSFEEFSKNAFKYVGKLRGTEKLILNCNKVSDADLNDLRGLENLKVLELKGANVTDLSFESITKFKGLTHLSLANTKITDRGIRALDRLKFLEELDLSDTNISGNCFLHLRIETLRLLDLSRSTIGEDCVDQLSKSFPNLEALRLRGTMIGDGAYTISELLKLKTLCVEETNIGNSFILSSLPNSLESLHADSTRMSDESIPRIRSLELKYFTANDTDISLVLIEEITDAAFTRVINEGREMHAE